MDLDFKVSKKSHFFLMVFFNKTYLGSIQAHTIPPRNSSFRSGIIEERNRTMIKPRIIHCLPPS